MKLPSQLFLSLIALTVLSGCIPFHAVVNEEKLVSPVERTQLSVTFAQPMQWGVSDSPGKTNQVWFPPGKYWLEAQDEKYYYFRSTETLGFKVLLGDKLIDQHRMPGGLFLAKRGAYEFPPAGVYLSATPDKKVWLLLLGADFLREEAPEHWKRDY